MADNDVEGRIDGIEDKGGHGMLSIMLLDKESDRWNEKPNSYLMNKRENKFLYSKTEETVNVGDRVVLDYKESHYERKGKPTVSKWIQHISRVNPGDLQSPTSASTEEAKPDTNVEQPPTPPARSSDFKSADKMSIIDDIKDQTAILQAAAIDITNKNLKTLEIELKNEDAWSSLVDTVFIQMARAYDKRGSYIKK